MPMQNPKITEIEKRFESIIIKVNGFENLVNVALISLDEIEAKIKNDIYGVNQIYESKNASTARFVLCNPNTKNIIFSTGEIPVQIADMPEK